MLHPNKLLQKCQLTIISLFMAGTAFAQLPFRESFKDTTAPGMVFGGNWPAMLTAGQTVDYPGGTITDPVGDGSLRLTSALANQRGYAYNINDIPALQGLKIAFEYNTYGGGATGADGICFFLFNTDTAGFHIGGFGGSLGYTRRYNNSILEPGLSGAYLGLGIDEYGNFCNYNEQRYTPSTIGTDIPNTVTIRGKGDGSGDYWYNNIPNTVPNYNYITHVQTSSLSADPFTISGGNLRAADSTDPAYRRTEIDLIPRTITVDGITGTAFTINIRLITGSAAGTVVHHVITGLDYDQIAPENLRFGFSASTGGSSNYHEIRNLFIQAYIPAGSRPVAANTTAAVCSGNTARFSLISAVTPVNLPLALDSSSLRFINPLNPLDTGTTFTIAGIGTISTAPDEKGDVVFLADPAFTSGTATIRFVMNDNYSNVSNAATLTLTGGTGISSNTITATTGSPLISGSVPVYSTAYSYLWQESITGPTTGFYTAPGTNNMQTYTVAPDTASARWYRRTVNAGDCISYTDAIRFSNAGIPLPLELLSFQALAQNDQVQLSWTTAKEKDIIAYQAERSDNAADFHVIGETPARNTNDNTYVFTDDAPLNGQSWYRLAIRGQNEKTRYSPVRAVRFNNDGAGTLVLYPEPASGTLQLTSSLSGNVVIYNAQGMALIRSGIRSGSNALPVAALPAGSYYLVFVNENGRTVKKFSKI